MGDGEKLLTHLNSTLKVLLGLNIFPRVSKKKLNFVDQCNLIYKICKLNLVFHRYSTEVREIQVYGWCKWYGKYLLLYPFSRQCSVGCGQGIRTRSVKCLGPGDGDSDDCPQDEKPTHEEICDMGPCATGASGSWFFTEWTQHVSNFVLMYLLF